MWLCLGCMGIFDGEDQMMCEECRKEKPLIFEVLKAFSNGRLRIHIVPTPIDDIEMGIEDYICPN